MSRRDFQHFAQMAQELYAQYNNAQNYFVGDKRQLPPAEGGDRSKRRRATAVVVRNQGGSKTVSTSTKKKKKSKKRINVVNEIRKIKKTAAIERNMRQCCHTQKTTQTGSLIALANERSNLLQFALGTKAQYDSLMTHVNQVYVDAAAIGQREATLNSLESVGVELSSKMKILMKNNDTVPCYVYLYDFLATDDHASNIIDVYTKYISDYFTGHATGTELLSDTRFNFSDGRYMKDFWKAKQFKKIYMLPGDEIWFYVSVPKHRFYESTDDAIAQAYRKGKTHIFAAYAHGVPCHGDTISNIGLTPVAQIDICAWVEETCYYEGLHNTMTYKNIGNAVHGGFQTMVNPEVAGVNVEEEKA